MTTKQIITTIKKSFIENLPEGIFLKGDISKFKLTEQEDEYYKKWFSHFRNNSNERENLIVPDKKNPTSHLTALFLKTKKKNDSFGGYVLYDEKFTKKFNDFWKVRTDKLNVILDNASEFITAETISKNALTYINIHHTESHYTTGFSFWQQHKLFNENKMLTWEKLEVGDLNTINVSLFIITEKYFINLTLCSDGVLNRTEYIIQKDIKKINISENNQLNIYFHGPNNSETILLDDYKTALYLQRHLTELRQILFDK